MSSRQKEFNDYLLKCETRILEYTAALREAPELAGASMKILHIHIVSDEPHVRFRPHQKVSQINLPAPPPQNLTEKEALDLRISIYSLCLKHGIGEDYRPRLSQLGPDIIEGFKRGDGDAVTQVVRKHWDRLVQIADKSMRSKHVPPEEIVNDAILATLASYAEGRIKDISPSSAITWNIIRHSNPSHVGRRVEHLNGHDIAETPYDPTTDALTEQIPKIFQAVYQRLDDRQARVWNVMMKEPEAAHSTRSIAAKMSRKKKISHETVRKEWNDIVVLLQVEAGKQVKDPETGKLVHLYPEASYLIDKLSQLRTEDGKAHSRPQNHR